MSVQKTITKILCTTFKPQELRVVNQSQQHQRGESESHFMIVIVCSQWATLSRLAQHRAIYQALATLLKPHGPIHALALHTHTLQEWSRNPTSPDSPPCANKVPKKGSVSH